MKGKKKRMMNYVLDFRVKVELWEYYSYNDKWFKMLLRQLKLEVRFFLIVGVFWII